MNIETIKNYSGPIRGTKYPWYNWLTEGTAAKPKVLKFGSDLPIDKKPAVAVAQLHQWARAHKLHAFTSVAPDKKSVSVYTVPAVDGESRPQSHHPYPKQEQAKMAKKKATASESPKATKKKASKKKPATKKKS